MKKFLGKESEEAKTVLLDTKLQLKPTVITEKKGTSVGIQLAFLYTWEQNMW